MSMVIDSLLKEENSLDLILKIQTIIHSNFTEENIEDMSNIQLDKHLFERINLAIEELVEANRELKHRKPHRVTTEGQTINASLAKTDLNLFKSELVDALQIIFSVMGAIGTTEDELYSMWREKVEKIKFLKAKDKYIN